MIENSDTLAFFFTTSDFGTTATITQSNGSSCDVVGIYDNPYLSASAGGMVEFSSTSPTFTARTVDFTGVAYGDEVEVGGKSYLVIEVMPDGTGITTLTLEEQ
jgi:hypothetical protein